MEKKSKSSVALRVVLSILVAIAVWLYVDIGQATTIHTVARNIPVEFSGENGILADRNLMLLSGYDTTIDLWLEGPRSTLWKLDKNKIRIVANTAGITDTGIQSLSYDVVFPDNVSRNNIKVEKASVYSVSVTVGELSTKEVPVYCNVVGQPAEGFFTEAVQLDPVKLLLRGQREDLLNVSYARIELDSDGAEKTVVQGLPYTLYDYNDIAVENDNIRTETKLIQATLPVKTTKSIPLVLNFVEAPGSTTDTMNCTIVPKNVTLSGDKDVLADVKSILLDTIYLQDLGSYQSFDYQITAPEGTELPKEFGKVTATIVIKGVSERILTVSDFQFTDVPEGLTATAVTESLDIVVRGLTADVTKLEQEDIHVTVSLANNATVGDYTVPVEVTLPGHPSVGAKGKYQLIVNLSVTPEPEPEAEPDESNSGGTEEPAG